MKQRSSSLAIVTSLVALIGFALRTPCAQDGWGGSAHDYLNLCYSDLGPLYYVRGFADGVIPYFQDYNGGYLEYPVLIGLWAAIIAALVRNLANAGQLFVYVTWLSSLAMMVGAVWTMRPRIDRAWWVALSPALLLALGINWDALAVLMTGLALWAWQRQRAVWAGVAIGVGTAAKLYPALVLVPIVFSLLGDRNWRTALKTAASALGAWLVINLPVALLAPTGWWEFYRFSSTRGIDFGSPWLAAHYLWNVETSTDLANRLGMIVMAAAIAGAWALRKRVDVATIVFALVAVFALVNKVYSPQYWLWLTPLAALSAVRLRHFVVWQVAELVYFVGIWRFLLFLTDNTAAGSVNYEQYGWIIAVHWVATAALVGVALLRAWQASGPVSGKVQP